ncbi:Leg1-related protein [Actinokineospora sp. PR83]|uniref:Leg1-related protein n=1 Tax=Actinokineospora sp. PR83 TaxID=2884908 RepID=UPI001F43A97D|nr:Leg1-related protein [Actinokineospora sp. PR83]MCG8915285.1 Leg1-related protein [Actinokineospora sp. PR83]
MAHPEELATLDLYSVWTTAEDLGTAFDPFRFEQRMAAYRLMIQSTNPADRFGADNRHNPLWGLMFQHQWQFRTGRLGAGTRQDGRIDPDSPWGYGNYTLSVIPWLGAEAAGVVPALPVADPPTRSRFRYVTGGVVPEELAAGVADWSAYFTLVREGGATDQEPARTALWKAHKTCLDVVVGALAEVDTSPWPEQEVTFLRGWCRMVDYLWAAAWPTDFAFMTAHGLDVLPETLLTTPEDVRALPGKARGNVVNVLKLATMPKWRYDLNLWLWKRVMRTREARARVLPLLDAVFNPRPENAAERRRLLGYLLRP